MNAYEPLELAKQLKEQVFTAHEIALAFKDIDVRHKAVTTGTILLNNEIFPTMEKEEMRTVLEAVFPNENINQAIDILYPIITFLVANEDYYDTGVDLYDNEVSYVIVPHYFCPLNKRLIISVKPEGFWPVINSHCLLGDIVHIDNDTFPHRVGRLHLKLNTEICPCNFPCACKKNPWIMVVIEKELVS